MRRISVPVLLVVFAATVGCGQFGSQVDERGKNRLAPVGETKYKAALTGYEDKQEGYRLDISFEMADADHKPVPLPIDKFEARVKGSGGQEEVLEFKKKPLPTDPTGKCSRFTAAVPSRMSPDDKYTITASVEIDGKKEAIRWDEVPLKKYTHSDE